MATSTAKAEDAAAAEAAAEAGPPSPSPSSSLAHALSRELSLLSPRPGSPPQLEQLVASTRRCHLTPVAFMVSWQGVLTLAYRGFPPALVELKQRIELAHGHCLPRESPGSKWPKTTLAALKDGKRLTPQQLETLNELCAQESAAFHYEGDRASLAVTHASVVVFACRSLERVVAARDVALDESLPEDDSPPDAAAEAAAAKVIAEPSAEGYWVQAAADGNRESHYRGDHVGVTLVFRHRRRDLGLRSGAAARAAAAGAAGAGAGAAKGPKEEKKSLSFRFGSKKGAAAAAADGDGATTTTTGGATGAATATAAATKTATEPREGEIGLARLAAICDDFQRRVEEALPGMYAWFEPTSRHVTLRGICG